MANTTIASLSDLELLIETARAAADARRTTAELIALLAEVDTRRLYLGRGYSSFFAYCNQALYLSEAATYLRIAAARASHDFPIILKLLADGAMTLTTISLLASHLTAENHDALLAATSGKSRRDVEKLAARLAPKPDVTSSVRRLPEKKPEALVAVCPDSLPILTITAPRPVDALPTRARVDGAGPATRKDKVRVDAEAEDSRERDFDITIRAGGREAAGLDSR
jgi:hypothetical protein